LDAVREYVLALPTDTIIISGGARGVDTVATMTACFRNLKFEIFYPDWKRYGKSAGFIRNEQIVKAADKVVAFWDGKSKGTAHSIKLAKQYGKPIEIIEYET
jgi:hypothetical protein